MVIFLTVFERYAIKTSEKGQYPITALLSQPDLRVLCTMERKEVTAKCVYRLTHASVASLCQVDGKN